MEPWLEAFARANFARSADTAHDLKTPLNVAVLNLELLRMRIAKLSGLQGDEKINAYARSLEMELRRMARIFDTFFLMSSPPGAEGQPGVVDISPVAAEVGGAAGFEIAPGECFPVRAHESRIRQALRMFFDGVAQSIRSEGLKVRTERNGENFRVVVPGTQSHQPFELTTCFKFYTR